MSLFKIYVYDVMVAWKPPKLLVKVRPLVNVQIRGITLPITIRARYLNKILR